MCAEKDPITCHRSILVCRHLRAFKLSIAHILADGRVETHDCLEQRLLKTVRINGEDLLNTRQEAVEHAYDLQGDKIAYIKNGESTEKRD